MRTKKTVLLLISGLAGGGKTTAKNILLPSLESLEGLTNKGYSFADPLKYIAKAFFGWDGNKDEKGRKLLQDIGRVGREYDQDIWCKHLLNQLDKSKEMFPYNFVVVDDWRYPNEADFFRKNPLFDVVTIRVFGRGGLDGDLGKDTSETSLPEVNAELIPTGLVGDHWYDYQVDNSGTEDELKDKIGAVLSSIKENYIV